MKKVLLILGVGLIFTVASMASASGQQKGSPICNYRLYQQGAGESVPYVTGGVGKDERACLHSMETGYNLKLVFALKSKEYLATPMVTIQDKNGKEVLHAMSNGPWFLTKVPAGEYKVTVSRPGHGTEVRHVRVGQKEHTSTFVWNS
jgi:hypothetical protein